MSPRAVEQNRQMRERSSTAIRRAALWLCSEASSFVTGHSMIVDGGVSSLLR